MIYVPDHIERGLALIVSQFQAAAQLRAVVRGILGEVQLAEDTLLDLATNLTVDAATGAQLELLGRLLGERRDGLADSAYRRYLRARMMIRLSEGTIDEILEIASTLSGGTVRYSPAYPAGYRLHLATPVPPELKARFKARLLEATPAGVGLDVTQGQPGPNPLPFTFNVPTLGFNRGRLVEIF